MSFHLDLPYLMHILDVIRDTEESVKGLTRDQFESSKDARDASILRILVVGETVKRISPHLTEKHPEIEWKKIAGTRDRMIHAYFDINLNSVWEIVQHDLPIFKDQIKKIKKELENRRN